MEVFFAEAAWLWPTKLGAAATAIVNAAAAMNSFFITGPPLLLAR
jgi:hypothetical protein